MNYMLLFCALILHLRFSHKDYAILNVGQIQEWIDLGRLVPKEKDFVTTRDLVVSGVIKNVQDGVKILGKVRVHPYVCSAMEV